MSLPSGLDNWKTVICNLDHLHQEFSKLKQSICLTQMQAPQMQTPQTQTLEAIHTSDTPIPRDIDQSQPRPKTCTCYNCGEPGHLSPTCMKPQKQRIWLTILANMDIKSLVAEAVAAAMDVREAVKKAEQVKELEKMETEFQAGKW